VVGSVSCGGEAGGPSVAVARLRPDGALDSSFEYGGTHVIDFGHSTVAASVAVTSNGRILLGADDEGGYDNGSPLRVAGLRQDGSLDRGFGRRGRLRIDVPQRPDAFVGSIQLDPVGRLVLIGTAGGGHQPSTIVVARVTRTGHLDRRFGHAGISVAPTGLARSLWGWHGTLLPDVGMTA
jgi:uncharacterized delta-60 repeat protein